MKTLLKLSLFLAVIPLVGCDTSYKSTRDLDTFSQVEIIESGIIGGCGYAMFKDKISGNRIMYYREAMVVLPRE